VAFFTPFITNQIIDALSDMQVFYGLVNLNTVKKRDEFWSPNGMLSVIEV
jgi:hypothetical protein